MPIGKRGQALVEFALVSSLLFPLILGIMDWSYFFTGHIAATNATRSAARFAAVSPTAWSDANPPAAGTIEGRLLLTAVPATLVNQDPGSGVVSYIQVRYVIPGPAGGTPCGYYDAASDSFVGDASALGGSYTEADCVAAGNLVTVEAQYSYRFITPFLQALFSPGSVTIKTEASELIET